MAHTKTSHLSQKALKTKYLECLRARSTATPRETIQALVRSGVRRSLLLTRAVAAGQDRKQAAKGLAASEFKTAGLSIIPEPELHAAAVERFSKQLNEIAEARKSYERVPA
jgi:hypothetical protein